MGQQKLPYMPLYVYDLESDEDTRLMSLEEFGAYMRLLCRQWIEGSIPADPDRLAKLLGIDRDGFDLVWPMLEGKFAPADTDGRLFNERLDRERQKQMAKIESNRRNGQMGGRPPNPSKTDRLSERLTQSEPDGPIRASDSDSGSGSAPPGVEGMQGGKGVGFEPQDWPGHWVHRVVQAYPRTGRPGPAKQGVRLALTRVQDRFSDPQDAVEWLVKRAQEFGQSPAGKRGSYTPAAGTWFSEEGYDQADAEWAEQGAGEGQPPSIEHLKIGKDQ